MRHDGEQHERELNGDSIRPVPSTPRNIAAVLSAKPLITPGDCYYNRYAAKLLALWRLLLTPNCLYTASPYTRCSAF